MLADIETILQTERQEHADEMRDVKQSHKQLVELLQAERQKREEVVEAEKIKYKNIIHEAYNVGFNEDCIQCGLKDKALGKGL